jgi:hypothetical protein
MQYIQGMNNHHITLSPKIRRQLWRRIWYSFLLSLLIRPAVLYGVIFGASIQFLRELVFVKMVITNFLAVEVGQVPVYVYNIMLTTDILKVALVFAMIGSLLLLVRSLRKNSVQFPTFVHSQARLS